MYISISLKLQWVNISPDLSVPGQQVKNPWLIPTSHLIGREIETQKSGSFLRSGSAWQSWLWKSGTCFLIQFCTHSAAYFMCRRSSSFFGFIDMYTEGTWHLQKIQFEAIPNLQTCEYGNVYTDPCLSQIIFLLGIMCFLCRALFTKVSSFAWWPIFTRNLSL